MSQTLYEDVVTITYDYLGPAADRFVVRQIRNHLRKRPEELERKDLQKLMDWIQLAMRLISSDGTTIDSYMADLRALTQSKNDKPVRSHGKAAQ
jgi:hypothetical protein